LSLIFCPRCQQKVDSQAIACPYCRAELKAFGHPGIPLHRAAANEYLCKTCTYNLDDSCNYPQRPLAKVCTLYENFEERQNEKLGISAASRDKPPFRLRERIFNWSRSNQTLLLFLGLFLICVFITILTS
jgi:Double zinc ribbon